MKLCSETFCVRLLSGSSSRRCLYWNFLIFSMNEMFHHHPVSAFPLRIIFGNSFINVSFWFTKCTLILYLLLSSCYIRRFFVFTFIKKLHFKLLVHDILASQKNIHSIRIQYPAVLRLFHPSSVKKVVFYIPFLNVLTL